MSPLPRERRDTLFMLGVLAWTLAPQIAHLPAWCSLATFGALAWRAALAWQGRPLPPRALLVLLLLAGMAAVWSTWRSLGGRDAGLALLCLLAGLKTLELRARRDALVLFFLGFFLVLANFLHSQSLAIALAMALAVWGLLAALVLAHRPVGRPPLREVAGSAARLMTLGAPLVLLLFVFFPRIAPLWGVPGEAGGRSGLSDQLQLGDVAALALDDSPALRVQFLGPVPPPAALYFRGPVLSQPEGQRWTALPWRAGAVLPAPPPASSATPTAAANVLAYEMTVEPLRVATLPLLETVRGRPELLGGEATLAPHPEGAWISPRALAERLRLRARAELAGAVPALPAALLDGWLALPPGEHPRTRAWAAELARRPGLADAPPAQRADRLVAALLAHLREGGYRYSLAPGLGGPQPLDHFWLDGREGFCEHYASATVVVLRAAGVPARIVTGYQGGLLNPIDGVLEVRQSDAHAWAEYWRAGQGWVRVDPTAAVAPARIAGSQRLNPPQGLVAGALAEVSPALLEQMRALWGALDHRWNLWVLGHGRGRQLELLRSLGWNGADLADLGRALALGLGGALGLGAAYAAWRARHPAEPADAWLRRWRRLRRQLAGRGLASSPQDTPRQLATRLAAAGGSAHRQAAAALLALEALRYRPAPAPGTAADAARALDRAAEAARRAIAALPRATSSPSG